MFALIIVAIVLLIFVLTVLFGAPYVPTRQKWAESALELAGAKKGDTIVDLGSGDGIILKVAAERKAKALGYEINPILVVLSKLRLFRYRKLVKVKMRNFWQIDLPRDTTILYIFPTSKYVAKFNKYIDKQLPKLKAKELKVVTFGFELPGRKLVAKNESAAYLYEVS